jgi:hypothetical protein
MNIAIVEGEEQKGTEYQSLACNVRGRDGTEGNIS